ncbi:hypothetical protein J6590_010239 [Homalodisca vitripennis]|nr:hypothetical protein J6590_010239 [Homalodisca vitripennis]
MYFWIIRSPDKTRTGVYPDRVSPALTHRLQLPPPHRPPVALAALQALKNEFDFKLFLCVQRLLIIFLLSRDHFWLVYTFQLNLPLGTAKTDVLLNLGNSVVGEVRSLKSQVLASLNMGVPPPACFDWRGRGYDEISAINSSSGISIGGGPYPRLPIPHPPTPLPTTPTLPIQNSCHSGSSAKVSLMLKLSKGFILGVIVAKFFLSLQTNKTSDSRNEDCDSSAVRLYTKRKLIMVTLELVGDNNRAAGLDYDNPPPPLSRYSRSKSYTSRPPPVVNVRELYKELAGYNNIDCAGLDYDTPHCHATAVPSPTLVVFLRCTKMSSCPCSYKELAGYNNIDDGLDYDTPHCHATAVPSPTLVVFLRCTKMSSCPCSYKELAGYNNIDDGLDYDTPHCHATAVPSPTLVVFLRFLADHGYIELAGDNNIEAGLDYDTPHCHATAVPSPTLVVFLRFLAAHGYIEQAEDNNIEAGLDYDTPHCHATAVPSPTLVVFLRFLADHGYIELAGDNNIEAGLDYDTPHCHATAVPSPTLVVFLRFLAAHGYKELAGDNNIEAGLDYDTPHCHATAVPSPTLVVFLRL